jgi:hypothetical protein
MTEISDSITLATSILYLVLALLAVAIAILLHGKMKDKKEK